ncbi:hypothetical protein [Leifsonia shinshuensis]|uniref:Alkaline phosphatase family protein n=1 Tax=Leifsonia shinshuensis TaxID=150026 RepID=A0A7G6YB85_9MICO|nr:hypothetical protein [Leifsonia shinshuensis]QNE35750.1 hypothetical protein F1C12_11850 [Leifsonia shinshuensis]
MNTTTRRATGAVVAGILAIAGAITGVGAAGGAYAADQHQKGPVAQPGSCQLANGVKHVVQIQFDNLDNLRTAANVPSDLEQMPNLTKFLETNGVLLTNTHDVLSHTATNFVANQTGLYPDRNAITQSNSFSYYDQAGATHTGLSFSYWTDKLTDPSGTPADTNYSVQYAADRAKVPNTTDVNAPAPWVPYTRAGCNVGEVGMSNTVLENTTTDIQTVFGADSAQAAEATANPAKATADVVGLAVHCANGASLCASGQSDALPDEPGGYAGYKALFGNAQIQPAVSPAGPIRALNGSVIADPNGNAGFPGFDAQTPTNSLGYAANLLEHGVQVANVYVSDAHTDHTAANTGDLGPGEPTYTQQLHDYDQAFGQFFARLASDGITTANTEFVVTTDEGDHFSGSAPTPANCTGAADNPCSYATKSEVNVNLPGLLATQKNDTTPFAIHSDPAPALWITGNPAPTDPKARQLARDLAGLSVTNPLTGGTDQVAAQLADPVEEKILHFVSSDPARTPSLTAFSGEDDYITSGAQNCTKACVYTSSRFAYNHGGLLPDMQDIWAGYAGPGISARGVDSTTWTDQVDMRPTVLALTGLQDDYPGDGRVLTEIAATSALPTELRGHHETVLRLGQVYKQILATNGQFAADTLTASTKALASGTATDDSTYTRIESGLVQLDARRDALADAIRAQLLGAAFDHRSIDENQGKDQLAAAARLLSDAEALAG